MKYYDVVCINQSHNKLKIYVESFTKLSNQIEEQLFINYHDANKSNCIQT